MFFKGSRYEGVETHELEDERGRTVRYKRIRFIEEQDPQGEHVVREEERLDHIAHRYFEAPDRFWRICDANDAIWPPDLVSEPGLRLTIPSA